eukprot:CAMPEP_0194295558 /NCGR_PEP_ID=MMETSP0169-20130528/53759_1 /TAXON_ID=218684 /ORGANISM="Corethron pennatum, Strain L29A3" /LENGTH=217 /DNA_ID=CAMNT_0039044761 /DNA_START=369 /DNA_END=1022 /DNA_ORIENTATION=+
MAKKKKKNKSVSAVGGRKEGEKLITIDPDRIRFQHSRIRPYFSGCGRGVKETLDQIRNKEISASDLPIMQVLMGPDEMDGKGPWYFGLNNRRLWVFKKCKEEGLLPGDGLVLARVRAVKSYSEGERYTLENCALQAKFMHEPKRKTGKNEDQKEDNLSKEISEISLETKDNNIEKGNDKGPEKKTNDSDKHELSDDDEDAESSDDDRAFSNRFSGLM